MKRLWRFSLRHFWISPWFIALPVTVLIINKFNKKKISYIINDLQDEQGKSSGTRVTVTIPVDMNYSFCKS